MPAGQWPRPHGRISKLPYKVFSVTQTSLGHPSASTGAVSVPARAARHVVVALLLAYKAGISPALPTCCKFQPTCSVYAREAVERFGVIRGLWMAAKRIFRCRPFAPGGHDPVPDA